MYVELLKGYDYSRKNKILNLIKYGSTKDSPRPVILEWLFRELKTDRESLKISNIRKELETITEIYVELILSLEKMGLDKATVPDIDEEFTSESNFVKYIKKADPPSVQRSNPALSDDAKRIALSLFHWTAKWIQHVWRRKTNDQSVDVGSKGYLPSLTENVANEGGLAFEWKKPGHLGIAEDVQSVLKNYYRAENVASNGWADPIAVAKEFEYQIVKRKSPNALRKLEVLLAGRASGILEFKEIEYPPSDNGCTLEYLIKQSYPNYARYKVVHRKNEKLYGFSVPDTLLCPVPDLTEEDWKELWDDITDHGVPDSDWKDSDDWGYRGGNESRECVAVWIKRVLDESLPNHDRLEWAKICDTELKRSRKRSRNKVFGIAEWLPLDKGEKIPVPVLVESTPPPRDFQPKGGRECTVDDVEISDFKQFENFKLISDFSMPRHGEHISMIWREHLELLQKKSKVFAWGEDKEANRIWIMENLRREVIWIKNIRVIDLNKIKIEKCIPIKQNLRKSHAGKLKYPDLPLLPDYIGLAGCTPQDEGEFPIESSYNRNWEEVIGQDVEDNVVRWKDIYVLGRSKPVTITVPIDPDETATAHWMIWPNFKSKKDDDSRPWRAYYVYEQSESLRAQVLYLDDDKLKLEKHHKRPPRPSRALSFDTKERSHTGGPPVAFYACDHKGNDVGIYTINLQEFPRDNRIWELAVDFGTSHTVAAIGDKSVSFNVESETGGEVGGTRLISEDWGKNVTDALDVWRPTYYQEEEEGDVLKSTLPSELWSFERLDSLDLDQIDTSWEPLTHYSIPAVRSMKKRGPDGAGNTIGNFKWEMKGRHEGREDSYRKMYLLMAIEFFLATYALEKQRLPDEIKFIFTYPLRGTSGGDTGRYQGLISRILQCSQKDLGYKKHQKEYCSESHAAMIRMAVYEAGALGVKIVADLGGGTLDILLSTPDFEGKSGRFKKEVADSAKLGTANLLRILVKEDCLPSSWKGSPNKRFQDLCAWMRLKGSDKLFKMGRTEEEIEQLGLKGFTDTPEDTANANNARRLIERYLRLIIDFLARNLVAYVGNVYEKLTTEDEREKLKLIVKLQGNGWRLWYETSEYEKIQEKMSEWVRERVQELWSENENIAHLGDRDQELWGESSASEYPKLDTIRNAKKALEHNKGGPDDTWGKTYRFPLSELNVWIAGERQGNRMWYDKLPFEKLQNDSHLEIEEIAPPLRMRPDDKRVKRIRNEMSKLTETLNKHAAKGDNKRNVPIGAVIWEAMLESEDFSKI